MSFRIVTGAFVALLLGASAVLAEDAAPPAPGGSVPQYTAEQLDQVLAPIALYPDPLLAQILMAATYPLEVVEADRWIHDPRNAGLKGAQLTAALEQESWDPSVKSLTPFPQILSMMDVNLDWTERLGDAFLADQAAVMDSVQRLRQRAKAEGKLSSTIERTEAGEGDAIEIEPLNPDTVYVPIYDPSEVYGVWPYPASPPCYFPGFLRGASFYERGFGWVGVSVVVPLWGWHHWDWARHRIDIDRDRFAVLNRRQPPTGALAWEHDPSHRGGIPYRDPGVRGRVAGISGVPEVRRIGGPPAIGVPRMPPPVPALILPQGPIPAAVPRVQPIIEPGRIAIPPSVPGALRIVPRVGGGVAAPQRPGHPFARSTQMGPGGQR